MPCFPKKPAEDRSVRPPENRSPHTLPHPPRRKASQRKPPSPERRTGPHRPVFRRKPGGTIPPTDKKPATGLRLAPASSVSVFVFSEDRTHVAVSGHSHPDEAPELSGPRRDLLDGISDREHAGEVPPVVAESPGTGVELSVDAPAPFLQFGHCPDFTIKHSTHHPNIYETYRT